MSFRAGSDFQYQLAVEVAVVRALHIGDLRNDAFGLIDLGIPESQSVLADGQLVALLVLQQRTGVPLIRLLMASEISTAKTSSSVSKL